MKKVLAVILSVVMLTALLCSCGIMKEQFKCGFCGKEVTSVRHDATFFGEDIDICQKCYDELTEAGLLK